MLQEGVMKDSGGNPGDGASVAKIMSQTGNCVEVRERFNLSRTTRLTEDKHRMIPAILFD